MKYDYLIIGGGIAGVTAAETIRELDTEATIGILTNEPYLLYSRVLLPSYLKGKIGRAKVFLRTQDDFDNRKINLHIGEEVVYVDTGKREVGLAARTVFGYGKLLIASGGRVREWNVSAEPDILFRLQTIDDADRLMAGFSRITRPLVIGGSFIALEFLESFTMNRIVPSLLVRDEHFFGGLLDRVGADLLHENFQRAGINVTYSDEVNQIRLQEGSVEVTTRGLRKIACDAVALGIGMERNKSFLAGSGITFGPHGGIVADEFLETTAPGVFAAGDIAEFHDIIFDKRWAVGNWTNAVLQGKRAGMNMAGKREPFRNVAAYSITNFGMQITAVGDCDPVHETIVRVDPMKHEYARLFLREDRIVGAALLNRFADKPHIARLIESRTPIGEWRERLENPQFDIRKISVVS